MCSKSMHVSGSRSMRQEAEEKEREDARSLGYGHLCAR